MKISQLNNMSVDALLDAKDAIETMLAERTAQLRKQLAALGVLKTKTRGKRGAKSTLKGKKVAPKYRGPNGETWAGRGAQPVWLRELLAKGRKLESFAVKPRGKSTKATKSVKTGAPKRKYTKKAKPVGYSQPEGQTGAS